MYTSDLAPFSPEGDRGVQLSRANVPGSAQNPPRCSECNYDLT
jgi:hypothetical protein